MTKGRSTLVFGSNDHPTAATVQIFDKKRSKTNNKVVFKRLKELQERADHVKRSQNMEKMTANKKPEKMFKKSSGEPYQSILSFPKTGKISLSKSKNYNVSVFIELDSSHMPTIISVLETDVGPNIIQTNVQNAT